MKEKASIKSVITYKHLIIFIVVLLLTALLGAGYYYINRQSALLPASIVKNIGFTTYYPRPLPSNYRLLQDSIIVSDGILFYTLQNNDNAIIISEQNAPKSKPDFNKLTESLQFKKIDTPLGESVIGLNIDKPTSILLTNTTLITITTNTDKVAPDILVELIKNMRSLHN